MKLLTQLHRALGYAGLIVLVALALVSLSGCGNKEDAAARQTTTPTTEAQIKTIQDNPKMPEEAKAAATASIQQHQAGGAYMRKAAGGK